jgi:hypothetical protein
MDLCREAGIGTEGFQADLFERRQALRHEEERRVNELNAGR